MSMQRKCEIFKADNEKWYLELGDFEYAYDPEDCTIYGPFLTEDQAENELQNYSNPGGIYIDRTGNRAAPKKPNY